MSSISKGASTSITESAGDFTEKGHSVSSRVSFLMNVGTEGKNILAPGAPCNIKIFNQSGDDVTPQPLNFQKKKVKQTQQSNSDQESFKERRKSSLASHEESIASELPPVANGFLSTIIDAPFRRNVFGVSLSSKPIDPMECSCDAVPSTRADDSKWEVIGTSEEMKMKEGRSDGVADVFLSETETRSLVELPSTVVGKDPVEVETVTKANEKYKQLLQSKEGSDAYLEKSLVTFNEDSKSKSTQTPSVRMKDASSNASPWECYDSTVVKQPVEEIDCRATDEENVPPLVGIKEPLGFEEISLLESFAFSLMLMERMLQLKTKQSELAVYRNLPVIDSPPSSPTSPTPASPRLEIPAPHKTKLPHGHQPITPSTKKVQRVDRRVQKSKVGDDPLTPSLERLWSYASSVIGQRGVACSGWNAVNLDLLVVGYGRPEKMQSIVGQAPTKLQVAGKRVPTNWKKGRKESSLDHVEEHGGMVCCWSIKNPDHPERIYKTDSAVKSVDFCHFPPNLLAVGLESGVINIYNVSSKSNLPIISSFSNLNKHQGPVWSLKWKNGDMSGGGHASLVSVSSDGKVLQWTMREEFECTEMLEMRRILSAGDAKTTSSSSSSGCEASFVSKLIGGMCLDFSPFNENIYLIGTEQGDIHKCDCAYTDQFLQTYKGHAGQVYQVLWSPFNPEVFLSCGSDWTIRLWVQNQQTPVLTMFSSQKSVRGVCWSPKCSTMFASVNSDQVEVWNLAVDLLEPILRYMPDGPGLTRALFSLNSDCILIGQKDGQVLVLKTIGISYGKIDQEEVLNAVIDSCEVALHK